MSFLRNWLGLGKKKKNKDVKTAAGQAERQTPSLGAKTAGIAGAPTDEVKAKVQREVCGVLGRTILELIQSSQARTPAMDELIQHQTINRLYEDVLFDFMAGGAPRSVDPAHQVLDWAREAMENWGKEKQDLSEDMVREMAVLSKSILAAIDAASRDPTLRKAAEERLKASGGLSAEP